MQENSFFNTNSKTFDTTKKTTPQNKQTIKLTKLLFENLFNNKIIKPKKKKHIGKIYLRRIKPYLIKETLLHKLFITTPQNTQYKARKKA